MQLASSLDRIESASVLDRIASPLAGLIRKAIRPRLVANTLHGVWVGHPVHPVTVQVPIGCFLSSAVLDLVPGAEPASRVLIVTGIVSTGPAVVTGLADWSQMNPQQQRVGLVHALSNTVGVGCYVASLMSRRRGRVGAGKLFAGLGLSALTVGASIGGHLAYRQLGGVNHAEDTDNLIPDGWQDLCAIDDLPPDGAPQLRTLEAVSLFVLRRGERIDVLSDRCSHLSGPLHEGTISDDGSCITCPWHGSTFRIEDGMPVRGPATAPQHVFDVRVSSGRVQVRVAGR